jgi:RNA polymerase sigma factor (sigma-70 family)
MHVALQQKESPEDVVQSALMSFFRRQRDRPFDLCGPESLWGLLATITLRKCGHRVEYYLAACRDIRRESAAADPSLDDSTESVLAIAREPSSAEVAAFRDLVAQLLRELSEREREIVGLRLENYSVPEISRKVGLSEYLVRKALDKVSARWERLNT